MTDSRRILQRIARPCARHGSLFVAVALGLSLLVPAAHAKDEKKPKELKLKKNQSWVSPEYARYAVRSIAFAPVSTYTLDEDCERMTRQALEANFATLKYKAMGSGFTMDIIRKQDVEEAYKQMAAQSAGNGGLDPFAVRVVGEKVPADAMMFTHVAIWEKSVIEPEVRGQSFTQVGVDLSLWSLKDGSLLWRGLFVEKGEGEYNDPMESTDDVKRDPLGRSTQRSASIERLMPPDYPIVLDKVMTRAVAAMPPPAPAPAPAAAP